MFQQLVLLDQLGQAHFHFVQVEVHRANAADVDHLAVLDDVSSLGEGAVGPIGRIVHAVDDDRTVEAHLLHLVVEHLSGEQAVVHALVGVDFVVAWKGRR